MFLTQQTHIIAHEWRWRPRTSSIIVMFVKLTPIYRFVFEIEQRPIKKIESMKYGSNVYLILFLIVCTLPRLQIYVHEWATHNSNKIQGGKWNHDLIVSWFSYFSIFIVWYRLIRRIFSFPYRYEAIYDAIRLLAT